MTTAALVLAAGRGERLGRKEPKAFVGLCGRSLLARSVSALCAVPEIDWVQPVLPLLNNMDPPEHSRLRGGLRKHFMPAKVRALTPWIEGLVDRLLTPFADGGTHEFVEDFAQPLAMNVGCKVIGLPEEDGDYLRDVVGRFFRREPGHSGMTEDGLAAMGEMNDYLRRISAEQRANPPAEPNA